MLPDWLDYAIGENTAAAMLRGLKGPSADWGELVATAQVVMSHYQEYPFDKAERLYDEEQAIPLIAAARILDSASLGIPNIPLQQKNKIALTAAVAFAMYGNFTSAEAAVRRIIKTLDMTPSLRVLTSTIAPNLIGSIKDDLDPQSPEMEYLEHLAYYCYSAEEKTVSSLRATLIKCLVRAESAHESSLLRSSRLCLEHLIRLSVSRILKETKIKFPEGYLTRLVDSGCRTFLPPQYTSIVQHQILRHREMLWCRSRPAPGKPFWANCASRQLCRIAGHLCFPRTLSRTWTTSGRHV